MMPDGDQVPHASKKRKRGKYIGPKLESILEDDEFIPELRLKNEILIK